MVPEKFENDCEIEEFCQLLQQLGSVYIDQNKVDT